MMNFIVTLSTLLTVQSMLDSCEAKNNAGKVLIHPMGTFCNSRFRNMQKMGALLAGEGYQVHMLIYDNCMSERLSDKVTWIEIPRNAEAKQFEKTQVMDRTIQLKDRPSDFLDYYYTVYSSFCSSILDSLTTKQLTKEKYDLVIYDMADLCTPIYLSEHNVTSALYENMGYSQNGLFYPENPSYMPSFLTGFTQDMTFLQRLENCFQHNIIPLVAKFVTNPRLQALQTSRGLTGNAQNVLLTKPELVFVNVDFAFEFVRPLMPHVIPIGGVFMKPAEPLTGDIRDFVEGAKNGIIVVIFGTNDFTTPTETTQRFINVFRTLKERVIWKHTGRLPSKPGDNTKVLPWLPQNDLLGHVKTRLFISHCGASSIHEAVYHGVPVVAVPTLVDQFHQTAKLVHKVGMAVKVDMDTFTENELHSTIDKVMNTDTYRTKAKAASNLFRNKPISAKDSFLFWVKHLVTFGHANHLRSKVILDMPWYQYYLLDVAALLVLVVLSFLVIIFKCCLPMLGCCLRCLCSKKQKRD